MLPTIARTTLAVMLAVEAIIVEPPAAASAPTQEQTERLREEIVVMGRLDVAKIAFRLRGGRLECKVKKGTGNPSIDAMACAAVENCFARSGRFDQSTVDCIPEERRRLVRSYVAQRAAS